MGVILLLISFGVFLYIESDIDFKIDENLEIFLFSFYLLFSVISMSFLAKRLCRESPLWILPALIPGLAHLGLAMAGLPKAKISLEGKVMRVKKGLFSTISFPLDELQMLAVRWPKGSKWNPLAYYSVKSQSEFRFLDLENTKNDVNVFRLFEVFFMDIKQQAEEKYSKAHKQLNALKFIEVYLTDFRGRSSILNLWDFFFAPNDFLGALSSFRDARCQRLNEWLEENPKIFLKQFYGIKVPYLDKKGIHSGKDTVAWERVDQIIVLKEKIRACIRITLNQFQTKGLSKWFEKNKFSFNCHSKNAYLIASLIRFYQHIFLWSASTLEASSEACPEED